MTSRTFKSIAGGFNIGIHSADGGVQFRITNMRGNYQQFITPADVAAEQALAILEAAGYKGILASEEPGNLIEKAYSAIRLHIKEQERATAEAEAQAKLEAEALKLLLAFQAIDDPDNRGCEWHQYGTNTKDTWLAVARRAREIAKEATK